MIVVLELVREKQLDEMGVISHGDLAQHVSLLFEFCTVLRERSFYRKERLNNLETFSHEQL